MIQDLIQKTQWGGTDTDRARDQKEPGAALTRNVVSPDGTFIMERGGCVQKMLLDLRRSHDTLVAFRLTDYPDKIFLAQVSKTGVWVDGVWTYDITGTCVVKALGLYEPEHIDKTAVGTGDLIETADGELILILKGEATG